ncbi:YhcH/YjgK/YiaL family protein [Silvimonas iriomotensis]|uniref:YhcH/YjgK/YiaL family protein n=1 Tax=Silvimonas iriomotensis TaxID=449662 RepID=A0ABQ2PAP5_9NEIS|nr:YhcH/YjgK/YiaL family protein [Silvimonas iriomotensis]GGP22166.1 hypothetical protein GCM10010970_23880 [Silvimonas iriomotensis]
MILSDLSSWQDRRGYFPAPVNTALAALAGLDLASMAAGKYPLDHEGMFFMIQTPLTAPAGQHRPEAHVEHVDIQLVLSGTERYGVARRGQSGESVIENLWDKHDIAFFAPPANEAFFDLGPGMFAVFFPDDIHRPCCQTQNGPEHVRKVVVKIHRSLFEL